MLTASRGKPENDVSMHEKFKRLLAHDSDMQVYINLFDHVGRRGEWVFHFFCSRFHIVDDTKSCMDDSLVWGSLKLRLTPTMHNVLYIGYNACVS